MDKYIEICCLGFCFLHMIISFVQSFIQHKKIKSVCEKCLSPVVEGEEHVCSNILSSDQLELLVKLIESIRKGCD